MTLHEAITAGLPLVVEIAPDNRRLAAAIVVRLDGIAFADIGWPVAGRHTFHKVEGKVSGDGPWMVGDVKIVELDHGDTLVKEWKAWQQRIEDGHYFGRDYGPSAAIQAMVREFPL